MRKLIVLLFVLFSFQSLSEEWKSPNDSDRESSCRTILFEIEASKSIEDILLLKSTYKLLCENKIKNQSSSYINAFKDYSKYIKELGKSPSLIDKVACIDRSGYVMSKDNTGWDHKKLDTYLSFNEQTNGWDHQEVQSYLKLRPLLKKIDSEDVNILENFLKSGRKIEELDKANQLWELKSFQKKASDIEAINNQIQSLNLKEISDIQ